MFHMVFPFREKVLRFIKEHVLLYQHITEKPLRQKPVKIGNKKPPKKQGFRGSELVTSKTVVFGDNIIYNFS